jgi:DNA protecting protein DprA
MDKLETILTLMKLPGVGAVRLRRAISILDEAQVPIEEAFSETGRRLLTTMGLPPSSPQSLIGSIAEQLRRDEVQCLVAPFHALTLSGFARKNLPPVLFIRGPADLVTARGVGFCGSRSATERGLAVAADIAEQVADQDLNVVSGGAKGVDITAHRTALSHGGTTTVVLAEGILQYRMRQELRDVFDPARTLLVSEFFPDDRWLAGRAMQRNRTICAFSRALILIEARSTGGTFAAGEAALGMGLPLFTADYSSQHESNDGNRILLERGAVRLRQSRSTGKANLTQLLDLVRRREPAPKAPAELSILEQQDLFPR